MRICTSLHSLDNNKLTLYIVSIYRYCLITGYDDVVFLFLFTSQMLYLQTTESYLTGYVEYCSMRDNTLVNPFWCQQKNEPLKHYVIPEVVSGMRCVRNGRKSRYNVCAVVYTLIDADLSMFV